MPCAVRRATAPVRTRSYPERERHLRGGDGSRAMGPDFGDWTELREQRSGLPGFGGGPSLHPAWREPAGYDPQVQEIGGNGFAKRTLTPYAIARRRHGGADT